MDRPARFTTAFELVPRELAVKAVALNTIGFSMARVLGPAVAGYIIAAVGGAGSFFLQGVLYAASGAMVLMVAFPPRGAQARALGLRRDGRRAALRRLEPAHARAAAGGLAAVLPADPGVRHALPDLRQGRVRRRADRPGASSHRGRRRRHARRLHRQRARPRRAPGAAPGGLGRGDGASIIGVALSPRWSSPPSRSA